MCAAAGTKQLLEIEGIVRAILSSMSDFDWIGSNTSDHVLFGSIFIEI